MGRNNESLGKIGGVMNTLMQFLKIENNILFILVSGNFLEHKS